MKARTCSAVRIRERWERAKRDFRVLWSVGFARPTRVPEKVWSLAGKMSQFVKLAAYGMLCVLIHPVALRSQGREMPPSPVRYTEARRHAVRESVVLPGTVEAPTKSLVAGEVAGLVIEFLAREGESVTKGQPLARLRTAPLELQREGVEAQLREAQARLKQAEAHLERARELLEGGVIPRDQFDDRFFDVDAWKGRV